MLVLLLQLAGAIFEFKSTTSLHQSNKLKGLLKITMPNQFFLLFCGSDIDRADKMYKWNLCYKVFWCLHVMENIKRFTGFHTVRCNVSSGCYASFVRHLIIVIITHFDAATVRINQFHTPINPEEKTTFIVFAISISVRDNSCTKA